ncbi:hypothetical protein QFC24_005809 [Naganishia onofrii]|uniref:Uncharacterized protein n=1 Tax=Naganishia onofrii TaxID=1851511 RepID=A0ACC2X6D5_9TREE|nr:hypothetical protein QFC24_005809 [Naganishia onofrii]
MTRGRPANAPGIEKDAEALTSSSSHQSQATAPTNIITGSPRNALPGHSVAGLLILPAEITSTIGDFLALEQKYASLVNLSLAQKQVQQHLVHLVNKTKVWKAWRSSLEEGGKDLEKKRWQVYLRSSEIGHLRHFVHLSESPTNPQILSQRFTKALGDTNAQVVSMAYWSGKEKSLDSSVGAVLKIMPSFRLNDFEMTCNSLHFLKWKQAGEERQWSKGSGKGAALSVRVHDRYDDSDAAEQAKRLFPTTSHGLVHVVVSPLHRNKGEAPVGLIAQLAGAVTQTGRRPTSLAIKYHSWQEKQKAVDLIVAMASINPLTLCNNITLHLQVRKGTDLPSVDATKEYMSAFKDTFMSAFKETDFEYDMQLKCVMTDSDGRTRLASIVATAQLQYSVFLTGSSGINGRETSNEIDSEWSYEDQI